MVFTRSQSGLIVPEQKPERPTLRPAQKAILSALATLSESLADMEQTTHGCMGPFTLGEVVVAIEEAYAKPDAYRVSELAQHINGFIRSIEQ